MKKTLLVLLVSAIGGSYGFSQTKVAVKAVDAKNAQINNQTQGINGIPTGTPNWLNYNFSQGTNDINECEAVDVPYVQTFESAVVPGLPECTTIENAGSGNNWQTTNGSNGQFTGTYLRYGWNSSNNANAWFYTQGINLEEGNSYKVSYEYGSAVGALYAENLGVAYGTENTHTAMTTIATHEGILSSYNKLTNEVVVTPTASGVYYFGFNAYSPADMFYLVLDNVKVELVGEEGGEEPTYCEPELDCTDGDLITNVSFQEISNATACSANGYGNYTSMIANVVAGETYPINVTVGSGFTYESVSVWIDYNNNGTFEESEFTYVGTGSGSVVSGSIAIPADAAEGNFRMRVRVAAVNFGTATWNMACNESQGYGETEDYTVAISVEGEEEPTYCEPELDCTDGDLITNVSFQEISNATACSANGYGNYTSMIANVVAGETYPINVTVGSGFTYESVSVWIDYNNNGTFEESEFTYVGTGSGSVVSGSIAIPADATEGNFRMRVRVAAVNFGTATWDMACNESQGYGETEDYTVAITVEEGGEEDPIYCEPVLDCTDADVITNVNFQEINNTTTCSENGYANFTSMVANVVAGEAYPINVTVGSGWAYESVSVWIDYNNNGEFEDSEFTYVGTGSASVVSGSIAIPADAAEGNYRMRVRVAAVGEVSATSDMACDEDQGFGETEDYTVHVGEATGGNESCEQSTPSNAFENGHGFIHTATIAHDFHVAEGTEFTVQTFALNVMNTSATTDVSLTFYKSEGGQPGEFIQEFANIVPTSQTTVGTAFGFNVVNTVVDLPTALTLEGEAGGSDYFVAVTVTNANNTYWESTSTLNTNNGGYYSPNGGETWSALTGGPWDGVFTISGECALLGAEEISNFDFAYYPNPAKEVLNIQSQKAVKSVQVFNLAGQQVMANAKVANGQINVSALPQGTYVFRVALEGGAVETFKIIKK
jgi:hypothetical protein